MPTTTPDIAEILTLLPSDVRAVRVFEILTIYWQGGIRTRHYSDGRWVEDFPALTTFGFDVIDARLTRKDWFVELPRTTEISDDTVKFKMWDADAVLISEFLNSGEGTRVRVAQYFPDYNLVNEIWWGFLKQPKETEGLWFNIDAASGLRSPNLIVPRRAIYPGCQAIFGGLINPDTGTPYFDTAAKIAENDCPYDRHIGGTYGTLNPLTGLPYTTCPRRIPQNCTDRLGLESSLPPTVYSGYHLSYMAFDVVIESVQSGRTWLPSYANDNVLRKPLRVVYGETWARDLILLAYVAESYGDHPANGFLRTLFAIAEGPIISFPTFWTDTPPYWTDSPTVSDNDWSGVVVNGQYVLAKNGNDTWGAGGLPRQKPTAFSPNVLNYPNTSVIRVDYGRGDFRNFNPDSIQAHAQIRGIRNVKTYATPTSTPAKVYTSNRAWCLLDLYTKRRYGLGIDISRFVIQDWIDLAAYCDAPVSSIDETGNPVSIKRSTFNADIQEGKWSDHLQDICLAGFFTLPYFHQGHIRIEPLEVGVPTSPPIFSDQGTDGTTRNIVFSNNQSTLTYSRESDSKIPNQIKVNYPDKLYQNQSRPLVLNDDIQQMKAGVAAGDQTSRPVTKEYTAVGTDNMAEAYRMAKRILDLGPFEQGGVVNNFKIKFTTWSLLSDVLGLHPYSIIKIVSQTVNRFQEAPGYPYEYFRILKLTRKANLQMDIEAQLFPRQYIQNNANHPPSPAVQNDGGSVLGAPENVIFSSLSTAPGTINFTLLIGGGGSAPDTAPPVIDSVSSGTPSSSSATITWNTNEPADSQIEYGLTDGTASPPYTNSTTLDSSLVMSHSQNIPGLSGSTTYHYRVVSRDAAGNPSASGDFTFTTTAAASSLLTGIIHYWKLEEAASANRLDSVGTNTLTPAGSTNTTAGRVGNCFDTSSGAGVLYGTGIDFTGMSFTIAGWLLAYGTNALNLYGLFCQGDSYNSTLDIYITGVGGGSPSWQAQIGPTAGVVASVAGAIDTSGSVWNFICVTFDASTSTLAISLNAGTPGTVTGAYSHNSGSAGFELGQLIYGTTGYNLLGRIDELGIWNRVLTSTEIATLYNGGSGLSYPF